MWMSLLSQKITIVRYILSERLLGQEGVPTFIVYILSESISR
ncbi:hypothetical protein [Chinese giant salamander iridovirus]|uniref:Uncharacterized protein n=1 Tax=Chinese giant salamander iridovirus TaxID=1213990 RepID=V5MZY7_FRG3V|nr:hypothetical protein [Chinese giant salamander iridovirus]